MLQAAANQLRRGLPSLLQRPHSCSAAAFATQATSNGVPVEVGAGCLSWCLHCSLWLPPVRRRSARLSHVVGTHACARVRTRMHAHTRAPTPACSGHIVAHSMHTPTHSTRARCMRSSLLPAKRAFALVSCATARPLQRPHSRRVPYVCVDDVAGGGSGAAAGGKGGVTEQIAPNACHCMLACPRPRQRPLARTLAQGVV